MRHSNRRGHAPYVPSQNYPEPSRVREVRDNRNRFMNDSDDYYGRYNRYETDAYERDEWDDQDFNQFGQVEFDFDRNERRNPNNYIDQGQRFPNRRDRFDDRYESDKRFQPQRGYGTDRSFERTDNRYDANVGYGSAWQQRGRYTGNPDHRGKGPKGYQRSTERIKEDVYDRLQDDYLLDASNIEIEFNKDEVILNGSVPDRNSKRRAEDIVETVSGIRHIENRIRVKKSDASDHDQKTNGRGAKSKASL